MCDSMQLFGDLMTVFCRIIPRAIFGDVRRLVVLAWAVVGVCLTNTVSVNKWGEVVISEAILANSRQRRFLRWLHNKYIRPLKFYFPLVKAALGDWSLEQVVYLALDTTDLHNGYILIRLAIIYRGRAIPLVWRVLRRKGVEVGYKDYKGLLQLAVLLLPPGQRIVLLADRGFVHAELVKFARAHRWGFRLRAKSNTIVRLNGHQIANMTKLCPPRGHAHFYHNVSVLEEHINGVHLALANPEARDEEPWFIISSDPTDVGTLDEYALRFDIEENFLDDKSGGFQVESGELDDPQAIARLFLVLAVATLLFTSIGVAVVKLKARRWVDTHWDRGLSYLQIGWRWLRQQFRRGWPALSPFRLDPASDPEPAIASRRHAGHPQRHWVVTYAGSP